MPPKKQEQSQQAPYKPCFVLPIFVNGPKSAAALALAKPVNIKKNIDTAKLIQVLKDKGLQQHVVNGELTEEGRKIATENLKFVCDQVVAGVSKPADPKKDAKKDAKKQAKKQQAVVDNVPPSIDIQFDKKCNDFFVFLSVPSTTQQLKTALSKDVRVDIVVIIKQKVKPGSRKPKYELLNRQNSLDQMNQTLKSTVIDPNFQNKQPQNKNSYQITSKKLIEAVKQYRSTIKPEDANKNLICLQVYYLDDISKPQDNDINFIRNFFQSICKCTKDLQQYQKWKASRKLIPMIELIKQVITKQVQVEDKADKGKKGGKSAQPVFETVTETIQRRFEDQPHNIKSDLQSYKRVKQVKKCSKTSQSNLAKNNYSVYKQLLNNCLESISNESDKLDQQSILKAAKYFQNTYELAATFKVTNESICNNLRSIDPINNTSMSHQFNFDFPIIQSNFSYLQLAQKSKKLSQSLRLQFLINKFQTMAKKESPKIQWSFRDRNFVQFLNKQQLWAAINQQMLKDPQVFSGHLSTQNINLLIMSRTNPPGRVLYHNSIFEQKSLPDFQNWNDKFKQSESLLSKQQFFNYGFEQVGNLAIKAKCMMPTDNTIMKDQMYTVGSKKVDIIQLEKDSNRFGLTKKQINGHKSFYLYWHDFNNSCRLRAYNYQKKRHISSEHDQRDEQNKKQESTIHTLAVNIESIGKYTVEMNPNPTIYWLNPISQKIRAISELGEVTSYRTDGSIHIYKPNGQVSIYRNGKWTRTPPYGQSSEKYINQFSEGQSTIKVRQNQTVIVIDAQGNRKIIFADETQIIQNFKQKTREIKNPNNGPFVRVYLPRDYNLNVIGHGSAFAYLGFKNILQRSYDGYLFEFIDHEFSTHLYTERFERNGKIETQQIRIIAYKDNSILRLISQQSRIVYVSPNKSEIMTQEALNQRWLQTFTTPTNQGEGVFNIDLNLGHIENRDSQTNRFIAKVDDRSEAQIAVSFITQDEDDSVANFPNGFHVKQQNYFLPSPSNRVPPRIFSINQDGSGCEFLNKDQIGNMKQYFILSQTQDDRKITQYSFQAKPVTQYMSLTFSKPIKSHLFRLPDILRSTQTRQSLIPSKYYDVRHRVIQQVDWDTDFTNVKEIEAQLTNELSQKKKMKEDRQLIHPPKAKVQVS